MRSSSRAGWIRALSIVGLSAIVLTSIGASGPRLVGKIDEPFLLQGQPCPAGVVSIRLVSRYNPSSTFHRVCVGTECLGLFRAERASTVTTEQPDTIRFQRNRRGHLVLLGYTVQRGRSTEFFRFSPSPATRPDLIADGP